MFRLERSQLQTANKRDNPYEKLNKLLSTGCLKGFRTKHNGNQKQPATIIFTKKSEI